MRITVTVLIVLAFWFGLAWYDGMLSYIVNDRYSLVGRIVWTMAWPLLAHGIPFLLSFLAVILAIGTHEEKRNG